MWFTGVEVEQETSAPPPKKILDPPLVVYESCGKLLSLYYWILSTHKIGVNFFLQCLLTFDTES